jgi:ATP-binding cassette subfamily G (WHITE) protein 5 (sterolin 1)
VDRRSRDRFLESNQQISVLVDKFKVEGGIFLKEAPASTLGVNQMKDSQTPTLSLSPTPIGMTHKSLQNRGIKPGCFSTLFALYLLVTLNFKNAYLFQVNTDLVPAVHVYIL